MSDPNCLTAELGPISGRFQANLRRLSDLRLNLGQSWVDFDGISGNYQTLNYSLTKLRPISDLPAELGRFSGCFQGNLVPMSDLKSLTR